jgi:Protein of unknown function (DUF3224)
MTTHADATFKVDAWDERPWDSAAGQPKMTRAEVSKSFEGDLVGTSRLQYLMTYRDDGTADFVAMERLDGSLGGKRGTFVLSHAGAFVDGAASGTWTIVEGSGTGELEGITGSSTFSIPKGEAVFPFALDYEIRQPAAVG